MPKRAEAVKLNASSIQNELLPRPFLNALRTYEFLESSLCFLIKNRITPTIEAVCSLFDKLTSDVTASYISSKSTRNLIMSYCGEQSGGVLQLHWIRRHDKGTHNSRNQSQEKYSLQILFTKNCGTSSAVSKKRIKIVENALYIEAQRLHSKFLANQLRWMSLCLKLLPCLKTILNDSADEIKNEIIQPPVSKKKQITKKSCKQSMFLWDPNWKYCQLEEQSKAFHFEEVSPPCKPSELETINNNKIEYISTPFSSVTDIKKELDDTDGNDVNIENKDEFTRRDVNHEKENETDEVYDNLVMKQTEPLDPKVVLDTLKLRGFYKDQITHIEKIPPQVGEFIPLSNFSYLLDKDQSPPISSQPISHKKLSNFIERALLRNGISHLFRHQEQALNASLIGQHVALSTGTSSGKSICFHVPVIESILKATVYQHQLQLQSNTLAGSSPVVNDELESPTALYLFPTKALTQDQHISFLKLIGDLQPKSSTSVEDEDSQCRRVIKPHILDGDTPFSHRDKIRKESNILMTNPDMLHLSLLPQHKQWKKFLSKLKYIVIDEAHVYQGIFGAHVAMIIRRLIRLCNFYQTHHTKESEIRKRNKKEKNFSSSLLSKSSFSSLQFIYCSATISNPKEHFEKLIPLHVLGGDSQLSLITKDYAPRGEKYVVMWNPPEKELASRLNRQRDEEGDKEDGESDGIHIGTGDVTSQQFYRSASTSTTTSSSSSPPVPSSSSTSSSPPPPPVNSSSLTLNTPNQQHHHIENIDDNYNRVSTIVETSRIFTSLIKNNIRTLCFSKTRKITELVLRYTYQDLKLNNKTKLLISKVKSYRGGYDILKRREIEKQLFNKELIGVTSTCALELGIDVGNLDVTLHVGFPNSISSFWQQAGRAGRSGLNSIAILVAFQSPIDQLFIRFPNSLFNMKSNAAVVPLDNYHVLKSQLLCASKELPLVFYQKTVSSSSSSSCYDSTIKIKKLKKKMKTSLEYSKNIHEDGIDGRMDQQNIYIDDDEDDADDDFRNDDDEYLFGDSFLKAVSGLLMEDSLVSRKSIDIESKLTNQHQQHRIESKCHPSIDNTILFQGANIRMIDPITISVMDITYHEEGELIDSISYSRAFYELFEGAIYLHQAQQYLVTKLNLSTSKAYVKLTKVNYFTSARNRTDIQVIKKLESGLNLSSIIATGNVNIISKVWGWRKHWFSGKIVEMGVFTLPPLEYDTRAMWIDIPTEIQLEVETFVNELISQGSEGSVVMNRQVCSVCSDGASSNSSDAPCTTSLDVLNPPQHHSSSYHSSPSSSSLSSLTAVKDEDSTTRPEPQKRAFLRSLHGLNHLMVAVAPLFVQCSSEDIGTEHEYPYQRRPKPSRAVVFGNNVLLSGTYFMILLPLIVLDKRPGGIGVSEALFKRTPQMLSKLLNILDTCPCSEGCLSCIYSSHCTNQCLSKQGTRLLARRVYDLVAGSSPLYASSSSILLSSLSPPDNHISKKRRSTITDSSFGGGIENDRPNGIEGPEGGVQTFLTPSSSLLLSSSSSSPFKSTLSALEANASPQRKRRLSLARGMDAARMKGSVVKKAWSNSMTPDYQSMFDE